MTRREKLLARLETQKMESQFEDKKPGKHGVLVALLFALVLVGGFTYTAWQDSVDSHRSENKSRSFAKKFALVRVGMTQKEVANLVGYPPKKISDAGRSTPGVTFPQPGVIQWDYYFSGVTTWDKVAWYTILFRHHKVITKYTI
jgi:hypothetical protein